MLVWKYNAVLPDNKKAQEEKPDELPYLKKIIEVKKIKTDISVSPIFGILNTVKQNYARSTFPERRHLEQA